MATNLIQRPGHSLSVVCSHPAAPDSGDPVRVGKMSGVALVDEGDGGNGATETTVDFGPSVWELLVDDSGAAGIAVGDALYYHDTATGSPTTNINNTATAADAFFGFALEAIAANATETIRVYHAAPQL